MSPAVLLAHAGDPLHRDPFPAPMSSSSPSDVGRSTPRRVLGTPEPGEPTPRPSQGDSRARNTSHPGGIDGASGSPDCETRQKRKSIDPDDTRPDSRERAGSRDTGQPPAAKRPCKARKRLQLACANCRRRKTKCTGTYPACGHCLRARIPCVYKETKRPAAPRSSYMAMLDKQMQRMEGRILGLARFKAAAMPSVSRNPVVWTAPMEAASPAEVLDLDADEFWTQPSSSEPGEENRDSPPPAPVETGPERTEFMLEGAGYLPTFDIQEHLSHVFFTHLYGQPYFLLHKRSYLSKLRAGTLPPVLILTVCAIAARFSTHPGVQTSPKFLSGERWASNARRICTSRLDSPNLTLVTCLILLSMHDLGTCHGARSWALGGQAIRMAFALRLHRENDDDDDGAGDPDAQQPSFVDREVRRRIMWACFIIDRFNSSSTARPIFIRDEMISIPEPIREDSFQLGIPQGAGESPSSRVAGDDNREQGRSGARDSASIAAHTVRAVSIWGKVIIYLNQGGRESDSHPMWDTRSTFSALSEQAETIPETLPASLAYNDTSVSTHEADNTIGQFFFLHATIQQNILALNHAILAAPQGVPGASLSCATKKAFVAAARISRLLAAIGARPVNAPFVGYAAFSSAMIQLEGIFSGNPGIESSTRRYLTTNIRYLHRMKHHWGVFHWMIEKVRERYCHLSDREKQAVRGPGRESGSRDIGDYSEWFDRYPRGVSHMNFVDPAEESRDDGGDDGVLEQKPDWITVGEYLSRKAPVAETPPGKDSQDGGGDSESDNELERLLMSLDESIHPGGYQGGTEPFRGPSVYPTQFTGDTFPLGNTAQVPGAYYDFLDSFSYGHGNVFGFQAVTRGDGTEMMPQTDLGQEGIMMNTVEGGGINPQNEDLEIRDSEDFLEAWSTGLDDLPTRIPEERHQEQTGREISGFEGCETLSVLQPYVV